jgi:N-methylhydantoinase A
VTAEEGFALDGITVRTILDMRYAGQSYELPATTDSLDPDAFVALFHEAHRTRYGHSDPSRAVEVVNLRVKLVLPGSTVGARHASPLRHANAPSSAVDRDVWFDGVPTPTAVCDRAALGPGAAFRGPVVVTQMDSTTVIPPGWRATVDSRANLVLEPA